MAELEEVRKKVVKENRKLDDQADVLVKDLEKYQKKYQQFLLEANFALDENGSLKNTITNYNKAQGLNPTRTLGLIALITPFFRRYSRIAKNQLKFNKSIGIETDIKFSDLTMVKRFRALDLQQILKTSEQIDSVIKKELVNAISLKADYKQTVSNIARAHLGRGVKKGTAVNFADSQLRTSLFALTRSIDEQIYEDIGETKFVYTGPLDRRTRDFCASRVGREFTRQQINQFPRLNGSGLNGFLAPGGYRCRHQMIGTSTIEDLTN